MKGHLPKNPEASFKDSPLSLFRDVSSQEYSKGPQWVFFFCLFLQWVNIRGD